MGDPYTDVTVLNYNDDAPADDGSAVPANRVNWATVTAEVGGPLKTAIESVNTNIGAAVDKLVGGAGVTSSTAPYTVQASDQSKLVKITSAGTLTTATAATVTSPFVHAVLNSSSGTLTIDGAGSETIDGETTITLPAGAGVFLFTDGTNWFTAGRGNIQGVSSFVNPLPRSYLAGLGMTMGSADQDAIDHDVIIAAGECRDTTNAANLSLSATLTKKISANWTLGDDAGGFPTGLALAADTWYHVFLVDDGSGATDGGFDTSLTATNLLADSGGSQYRRIGAVLTDGSSNITAFTQVGNDFMWNDPPLDLNSTSIGATATLVALSTPLGVKIKANILMQLNAGEGSLVYVSSPDQNDEAAADGTAPLAHARGDFGFAQATSIITDTSSQIRVVASLSNTDVDIVTYGYHDTRGRDD